MISGSPIGLSMDPYSCTPLTPLAPGGCATIGRVEERTFSISAREGRGVGMSSMHVMMHVMLRSAHQAALAYSSTALSIPCGSRDGEGFEHMLVTGRGDVGQ